MGAGRRVAGAVLLTVAGLGGTAAQTPAAHIYGSTEDVRFMSVVEGMLEARMQAADAPRSASGKTTIEFVIDDDGRVAASDVVSTSGDRALDASVVHAVAAAAPFPAPPPLLRGKRFVWTTARDPDGSRLTFRPQR